MNANKANNFLTYTLHDAITLDAAGTAQHTTTLAYSWPDTPASERNNQYGTSRIYRDYLRVYVPKGSALQSQSGWQPRGASQSFGAEVFAGISASVRRQRHGDVALVSAKRGEPVHGTNWQYSYLMQRQAGVSWQTTVQVTLPSCAQPTGKPVGFTQTGAHTASATQAITQNTSFKLAYSC